MSKAEATVQVDNLALSPTEMIGMVTHLISRRTRDGKLKNMTAPFIWGAPGIGKTDIVRQICEGHGSRCVAIHLPQYDPTDLKGIPIKNNDDTITWKPTSYLPQSYNEMVAGDFEVELCWPFAESLAVYGYDADGKEVARYNDPTLPDVGKNFNPKIERKTLQDWVVTLNSMPKEVERVEVVDKAIIFLDELSAAEPTTQNAALQLVLDRRINEYDVPHGVPVIAAGNRESDGAFVQPLSHPLANRFTHLTLIPKLEDFIDWAMGAGIRPEVIGVLQANPGLLFKYDEEVRANLTGGRYGFPTPRSWARLSDQFQTKDQFDDMAQNVVDNSLVDGAARLSEKYRRVQYAGDVGQAAAEFIAYLDFMFDLPNPVDIAKGGVPKLSGLERSKTFGLLWALVYHLQHNFDTHYDTSKKPAEQGPEWTEPRDNILDFITDNYPNEMAAWANHIITAKTTIGAHTIAALRGKSYDKFAKTFMDALRAIHRT